MVVNKRGRDDKFNFGFLNFEILVGHPNRNVSKEVSDEEMVMIWTYKIGGTDLRTIKKPRKILKKDRVKLWIQGCY